MSTAASPSRVPGSEQVGEQVRPRRLLGTVPQRLRVARRARRRAGGRIAATALAGAGVVVYLQRYFGVPWLLVILLTLTWLLTLLTRRTRFGCHLYAIGGNAEARRAAIPVDRTRLLVFTLTSTLAGLAGIVSASRQFSVSSGTGGGALLLEAIAAAVIGGTSLFGGRGRIYQALLGALVIVIVLAVRLDSVTRKRRSTAGT